MEEIKIKGLSLVHLNRFLVERFGEEGLRRVIAALPPHQARFLQSPYAHEWYPLRDHAQIEAKVMDVHFGGDMSKAGEFGRYDSALQIGKVYRVILRVLDPGFLIKKSGALWKQVMSGGSCEVQVMGPTSCTMKLSGYDQGHEVLCHDWVGTLHGMLDVCGARQGKVTHPECRYHGAPHCLYEVSWQR